LTERLPDLCSHKIAIANLIFRLDRFRSAWKYRCTRVSVDTALFEPGTTSHLLRKSKQPGLAVKSFLESFGKLIAVRAAAEDGTVSALGNRHLGVSE
jgi:hypothetical protein